METLKIFRTHPTIRLPAKQTTQSACFDLTFQGQGKNVYNGFTRMSKPFSRVMNNQIVVGPGDRVMIPTGLILDIPQGYSVRVHARSGLSLKQGLVLANAEGVIDSDYVEELMVLVHNISDNQLTINSGDRIAQAELVKDVDYQITESATRPGVKTNRTGGMGSTGIRTDGPTIILNIEEPKPAIPQKKVTKVAPKKVATKAPVRKARGKIKK